MHHQKMPTVEENIATARTAAIKKHEQRRAAGESNYRGPGTGMVAASGQRVSASKTERAAEASAATKEVLNRRAALGGTGGNAAANEVRMRAAMQSAEKVKEAKVERSSVGPSTPKPKDYVPNYMKSSQSSRSKKKALKELNKIQEQEDGFF